MHYIARSFVLRPGHQLLRYVRPLDPTGWYVAHQRGCVLNIDGPFETEREAERHAAGVPG